MQKQALPQIPLRLQATAEHGKAKQRGAENGHGSGLWHCCQGG